MDEVARALLERRLGGIPVEGSMTENELEALYDTAYEAISIEVSEVVEIGAFYGRSTITLATACEQRGYGTVYSIDPHTGVLDRWDLPSERWPAPMPTWDSFRMNLVWAGLAEQVIAIRLPSSAVNWHRPMALCVIDGAHDYESVHTDTWKFAPNSHLLAFHNDQPEYPGVQQVVREIIADGWRVHRKCETLTVLKR